MLGQETYLLCSATKQLFDLINFEHLSLRDDFPVHEKRRRGHDSCLSYRGWVCDVFDAHRTVCLRSSSLGVLVELVAALASRAQHRERDRLRPRRIAGVPAVARRSDIALGQLHDLHLAAAALLLFFLAEYLSEKSHFYILSLKGLLSLFCPHDITA